MMTEASEYDGQSEIAVSCTQLGTAYTASLAKKVVAEWVELLESPTPLTSLQFTSRTPKRLFAALAGQPQLLRLVVKWGDCEDLSPVASMTGLRHLELRGATAVSNVAALASLTALELLALEGFRSIEDLSPLGNLRALTDLELGGAWMTQSTQRSRFVHPVHDRSSPVGESALAHPGRRRSRLHASPASTPAAVSTSDEGARHATEPRRTQTSVALVCMTTTSSSAASRMKSTKAASWVGGCHC